MRLFSKDTDRNIAVLGGLVPWQWPPEERTQKEKEKDKLMMKWFNEWKKKQVFKWLVKKKKKIIKNPK